jgi:hypothetical protein
MKCSFHPSTNADPLFRGECASRLQYVGFVALKALTMTAWKREASKAAEDAMFASLEVANAGLDAEASFPG